MAERKAYPKILRALQASQKSMWDVVDAILEEAERSKSGNRMKDGEAERISDFLRKNGHRLGTMRIRHLYAVGWWVKDHARFREYSVQRVIQVMRAHREDYSQAARVIRSDVSTKALKREAMKPLTAMHRASGYLANCEQALRGARLTDDEWTELEQAAKELRAQVGRLEKLVGGTDFEAAVVALRPKRKTTRRAKRTKASLSRA